VFKLFFVKPTPLGITEQGEVIPGNYNLLWVNKTLEFMKHSML